MPPLLILVANVINGENINGTNYKCFENICIPTDYKEKQMPAMHNFTVYVNIEIPAETDGTSRQDEGLENINIHKMMVSYTPRIVVAWQDPRLFVNSNERTFHVSDYHINKIWIPQITVTARTQQTNGFMDYGRTGKN